MDVRREYYKFEEYNDHEGEIWFFFVPLTKAQLKALRLEIEGHDFYKLHTQSVSERDVDVLVEHSPGGYYKVFNKCAPIDEVPKIANGDDPYYKGQCWEVIK